MSTLNADRLYALERLHLFDDARPMFVRDTLEGVGVFERRVN